MKQVTAIIIGAGARGTGYAQFALDFPEKLKIVGVADPRDFQRNRIKTDHNIQDKYAVKDWTELVEGGKLADCAVIATPDRLHKDPALACAKIGYHILLEKPIAITYQDCLEIVTACKDHGCILGVAHVLRYSPQAIKIKELIDSGVIGEVANIQLLEPVGYWHFAHSYVRGNWRNEDESSFSLLAKSCHDIDLIQYWMGGNKCKQVTSFGSLKHFTKEQKPEGAGDRCLDCSVEKQCPYSAKKIYLGAFKHGVRRFPVNRVADPPDIESLTEGLRTGPYGRCVYECDNDVMDNQVVNMQYEDGATVNFSMVAFTEMICERQIRVFGPFGEITCDMSRMSVRHVDFRTRKEHIHKLTNTDDASTSNLKGHGKADFYTMDSFVKAIATNDQSKILTGPDESLHSHLLCFLAERARKDNKVVNVQTENRDNL